MKNIEDNETRNGFDAPKEKKIGKDILSGTMSVVDRGAPQSMTNLRFFWLRDDCYQSLSGKLNLLNSYQHLTNVISSPDG